MELGIVIINIVFCVIVVVGVIMTMVGLPGNILIVIAGLSYGYYENFEHMDYDTLAIIVGVYIVSEIIDFGAGIIGAKKEKASKRGMVAAFFGAVFGSILGTMILPLIGTLLGALVGAVLCTIFAEYTKANDIEKAKRVGISVLKGQIVSMIIKVVAAIGMGITLLYQLK